MSQDLLYIVRDPAGAIYGPANVGTLQQWIGEGRITSQMLVALQGTQDFRVAGEMPELQGVFGSAGGGAAATHMVTTVQDPNIPAYGGTPAYQNYAPVYQKSSGMAIAALVCGLASMVFCGAPAIVAIILGHIARGQIRREPERYEGHGMATAGMVLGYVFFALGLLGILCYVLFFIVMIGAAGAGAH